MTTDMAQFFGSGGITKATGTSPETTSAQHLQMGQYNTRVHNMYTVTTSIAYNTLTNVLSLTASGYLNVFIMQNECGATISDLEGHIVVDGTEVVDINYNSVADDKAGVLFPPTIFETGDADSYLTFAAFPLRFETSLVCRIKHDRGANSVIRSFFHYILD